MGAMDVPARLVGAPAPVPTDFRAVAEAALSSPSDRQLGRTVRHAQDADAR